jgi:hypothetical protein
MRPLFDLSNTKFEEDARVKFIYTSPEHHQNIEISIDGEETSVEVLMDAFKRFICALGVPLPPNVGLEFVEYGDGDNEEGEIQFTMEDEDDSDEGPEDEGPKDNKSKKKK